MGTTFVFARSLCAWAYRVSKACARQLPRRLELELEGDSATPQHVSMVRLSHRQSMRRGMTRNTSRHAVQDRIALCSAHSKR